MVADDDNRDRRRRLPRERKQSPVAFAREQIIENWPRIIMPVLLFTYFMLYIRNPSADARRRGSQLFAANKVEAAFREYQKALRLHPDGDAHSDRAWLHTQLGVCSVSLGRRQDAAAHFESALKLDPTQLQARKLLASQQRILASEASRPVAAAAAVRDGLPGAPPPTDARAMLRQAIATAPTDAESYGALARVLHRAGAPVEALEALQAAIALAPAASATAHHNAGVLQLLSLIHI